MYELMGKAFLMCQQKKALTSTATLEKRFCVHVHVLEFHYLKISIMSVALGLLQ